MDTLRVKNLNEFIGNQHTKQCLEMQIKAAKIKNKPLDHILFQGGYGCGKTSLAGVTAREMKSNFHCLNAASLTKKKHIFELACKIQTKDVVFIDEIHRLDVSIEEMLYPIMEDNSLILPRSAHVGDKDNDPYTKIDIPLFTLIGATTDIGLLSGPFLSRFPHQYFLEQYSDEDIAKILTINAKKLALSITPKAILEIAKRSRRIPRIANSRLTWIQDFSLANNIHHIDIEHVSKALEIKQIDSLGLEPNDRKYLDVLAYDKPLGLKSISAMTGLTEDTITKYIEPYLISIGKIEISQRGRLKVLSDTDMIKFQEVKKQEIDDMLYLFEDELDD